MNNLNKHILIAEDSLTQAMKLRLILENDGYTVTHAKDGLQAKQYLIEFIPDLLITDIVMPHVNGYELCSYVKKSKQYKNIPVLLLTTLSERIDIIKGLVSGADSFISKPFEQESLLQLTNKLILNERDQDVDEIIQSSECDNLQHNAINFLLSAYQIAIVQNKALDKSKKELQDININLERKVIQRTKEFEEAKLTAEKSDKLKSIFLSNASHDLRTPMNAIIGFSELLKDEEIDWASRYSFIDLISKNGENLLNLINDIIDISKIEAGVIKCKTDTNTPVNDLLTELEKTFKQYKILKDNPLIDILFLQESTIPDLSIQTDPFRLKQILSNLISNAVKFTKKGSVTFSYRLNEDGDLEFHVRDTGLGIPPQKLEGIFERYEQVKSTNNPEVGTGLGLAIARNLAELLGGRMWVESELGEGSCFYFTLPYKLSEGPVHEYFPVMPAEPKTYDFKEQLFMIVEDDMSNFNYLKAVLEKANAKVIWAKDGFQAIEKYNENKDIALVLMDIHLPKQNGFVTTSRLKQLNWKLPIIAQTAYAMSGDEQKCYDAGCDDYMAKPIKPPIMLSKISKFITYEIINPKS